MKKIIIFVIILSLLLTGCYDLTEPEKLGLVTLIGIDSASDGQIRLVIHEMSQQKQPSGTQMGDSGGGTSVKLHEATAPTVTEAVQKINSSDFRRTYFTHASAIILSEELVSSVGITPILDGLERSSDIRRTMWLLIAEKGQFDRIFSLGTSTEPGVSTGKIVEEIIANRPRNAYLTANTVSDFLGLLWERGSEPFTSGISLVEIPVSKENQAAGDKSEQSNKYDLNIENTAVFRKDKLTGWMNNEESMGLSWATGGLKGGALFVKFNDKDVALRIEKADSSIKPMIVDGKMVIDIHINATSEINESQINVDFEQNETIRKLQDLQAEEIKKQIFAAFNKSKSLNSDVFGFGNYFFGKYPQYWKTMEVNWYDHYRDIDVNIDVNSKVSHIGFNRKTKEGS